MQLQATGSSTLGCGAAIRVRPSALPVPSGSMLYSAGSTIVTRMIAAAAAAIAVVCASLRLDGTTGG